MLFKMLTCKMTMLVGAYGTRPLGPCRRSGTGVVAGAEGFPSFLVLGVSPPRQRVPVADMLLHKGFAPWGDLGAARHQMVALAEVADLGLERVRTHVTHSSGRCAGAGLLFLTHGFGVAVTGPSLVMFVTAAGPDVAILGHVPGFLAPFKPAD